MHTILAGRFGTALLVTLLLIGGLGLSVTAAAQAFAFRPAETVAAYPSGEHWGTNSWWTAATWVSLATDGRLWNMAWVHGTFDRTAPLTLRTATSLTNGETLLPPTHTRARSNDGDGSWLKSVSTATDGETWVTVFPSYLSVVCSRSTDGITWETPRKVVYDVAGGGPDFPNLRVVSAGPGVFVVFYLRISSVEDPSRNEGRYSRWEIMSVRSTDGGVTWDEPAMVVSPTQDLGFGFGASNTFEVAGAPNGTVLVVGTQGKADLSGLPGVSVEWIRRMVVRSGDGGNTWGAPMLFDHPEFTYDRYSSVTTDRNGTWVVLYLQGTVQDLTVQTPYTVRSTDDGLTWESPVSIEVGRSCPIPPSGVALATDCGGRWFAVWGNYDEDKPAQWPYGLYGTFSRDNGATWCPVQPVAGTQGLTTYRPVLQSDGRNRWVYAVPSSSSVAPTPRVVRGLCDGLAAPSDLEAARMHAAPFMEEGGTLELRAPGGATGYQWFHNGVPLTDTGAISGATGATLTITGLTAGDGGSYVCQYGDGDGYVVTTNAVGITVVAAGSLPATGLAALMTAAGLVALLGFRRRLRGARALLLLLVLALACPAMADMPFGSETTLGTTANVVEAPGRLVAAATNGSVWNVAWVSAYSQTETAYILIRASQDAGATWTPAVTLVSPTNLARNLSMATDGAHWVVAWEDGGSVYGATSANGLTWSAPDVFAEPMEIPPVEVDDPYNPNSYNKEYLFAPTVASPASGTFVLVYEADRQRGIRLAPELPDWIDIPILLTKRSTNGGAIWGTPQELSDLTGQQGRVDLAAGNGTLVIASEELVDTAPGHRACRKAVLLRSSDAGQTWSAPVAIDERFTARLGEISDEAASIGTDGHGVWVASYVSRDLIANTRRLYLRRSTDDGLTWSAPVEIDAAASGYPRHTTGTSIVADGNGNWLVAWNTLYDASHAVKTAYAVRSTDGGATWTAVEGFPSEAAPDHVFYTRPSIATNGAGRWLFATPCSPDASVQVFTGDSLMGGGK